MKVGDSFEVPFEPGASPPTQWSPNLFEKGFLVDRVEADRLVLVPLKPGKVELPTLEGKDATGKVVVRIPGRELEVESAGGGQRQQEIPEVLPPRELGLPISAFVGGVLTLALMALGIWALVRWSRRQKPLKTEPILPRVSPRDAALRALSQLVESDDPKIIKAQFFAVSDILKKFLGETLSFNGLESTDEEVVAVVQSQRPSEGAAVGDLFNKLDLTKYTDSSPQRPDLIRARDAALKVIHAL